MINKIVELSVNNRLLVFILSICLVIFGVRSFQELSIDAVPDITNNQIQVNTQIDGLVPEEIERMVTFPIEFELNGLPYVESIRSLSRYGISQVTVVFKDEVDVYKARQLVGEKLQSIELPPGLTPQMGPISSGLGEIFHYSIEFKNIETDPDKRLLQLMELRSLQDWFIKPRIVGVEGVVEVNTIGGFEKQFFIQPDIKKMSDAGIHFEDIEMSVSNTNINVGGAYIQQTAEQFLVRGVGLLRNIEDIENVIVKRLTDFKVIKIKDIAKVRLDKEIRTGAATANGHETIIGTAFMLLGENSRAVSIRVEEKIKEIQKDLPSGVELNILYNRSNMVNATLSTVEHNLLMGASLVILFLILLVGNFRAALITSLMIPVSLLITFILMRWQNVSGNLMSLGALDFGIIIDGSVIVMENCIHRLQQQYKKIGRTLTREEIAETVIKATTEIRSAAGFGELIVIVVFIPLFALTGIEGKMFGPMAKTFIIALSAALVLSFTLVPALAATFLSGKVSLKKPILMVWFEKAYRPLLGRALLFKRTVLLIGTLSIVLGGFLFSKLGSEFIPQLDEGDFAIQFIRPADITLDNSLKLQMMSEKIIKEYPQVKDVFGRTGTAEVATDPMGVNISDSYIMLYPKSEWPKDSEIQTKDDLISHMREKLESTVPAQVLMISQPVELRFNELLEGTRAEISAKIYGEDLDKVLAYGQEISELIRTVPGAGEVELESKGKSPVLQYLPKLDELSNLGVSARPVLDAINTAVGGKEIGHIYEGVRKFPIMIRLSEEERSDFDIVRKLPVGVSDGYTLPIERLAQINFVETYTSINRENSQRRIAILINPATRDIESFVLSAQKVVEEKVKMDEGYYIEWGGSFKNLQKAKERLSILVPIAMMIIIFMLYAAFKNIYQVILIFACAPMALIGGVIALNVFGIPFSISAGVGFIALSGISILNGVVLISYFNKLKQDGLTPDEVVEQGAMSRLRPVVMTALTDIFGFLPMMFATGLGAEVQKPLATVVVGGIISATLLTLIVIPTLYRFFYEKMK